VNQNNDALYRLDNNGTESSTSSSGFIGHRALSKRDIQQRRLQETSSGSNNLFVTGQGMGINGSARNSQQTSATNQRKPSEAFYLPVDSLVVQHNKTKQANKKRKKTGDAFMITFDGNNTTSQPLPAEENDSSGDSCDDNSNGGLSSHPSSRGISSIGDYSYNLSRSSSRNTHTVDNNGESRAGTRESINVRNEQTINSNKGPTSIKPVNKVQGMPKTRNTIKPKQPMPYQRPSRLGNVQSWRQNELGRPIAGQRYRDPYTEVDALNQVGISCIVLGDF
jgi:hypothetical protein